MRQKDLLRVAVGVAISVGCLFLLAQKVSVAELGASLATANPLVLIPALAIYALGIVARSLRWRVLLRTYGVTLSLMFRTLVIGLMVNDILPGRLGEIARMFLL